jgi:hypothetical protein
MLGQNLYEIRFEPFCAHLSQFLPMRRLEDIGVKRLFGAEKGIYKFTKRRLSRHLAHYSRTAAAK